MSRRYQAPFVSVWTWFVCKGGKAEHQQLEGRGRAGYQGSYGHGASRALATTKWPSIPLASTPQHGQPWPQDPPRTAGLICVTVSSAATGVGLYATVSWGWRLCCDMGSQTMQFLHYYNQVYLLWTSLLCRRDPGSPGHIARGPVPVVTHTSAHSRRRGWGSLGPRAKPWKPFIWLYF